MKQRCLNPNSKDFRHYGARGITICERWLLFENFLADMQERPPGMTLERIDTNGPYEKSNCKWATIQEQNNNKVNSKTYTIDGVTKNLSDWAKSRGMWKGTISARLKRGFTMKEALEL